MLVLAGLALIQIMTQILLSETWENLKQLFYKPEVHVLGFCSLHTSNLDGDKSQLFSTITVATTIHGIARLLENSTHKIQLKLLIHRVQTKRIQLSNLWYRVWQWCPTFSTSRDLISPSVRRGSLSLPCLCAQKSVLSSSHSPWLNAKLLPSQSFKITFKCLTCPN